MPCFWRPVVGALLLVNANNTCFPVQSHIIERARVQQQRRNTGRRGSAAQDKRQAGKGKKRGGGAASSAHARSQGSGGAVDKEDIANAKRMLVRCFLNVTSVMQCEDGFACVALSCTRIGAENAGSEVVNLYVAPQHLRIPADDSEWEGAAAYVLI